MKVLNNLFFLLNFILISFSLCECPLNCICEDESEECIECKEGYYDLNSNCDKECNKCPNKICDFNDGKCTNLDDDCIDKVTFGDYCTLQCSEKIQGCSKCHRDGVCFQCSDNHYYGANCNALCDKCPGGTCDFDGKCTDQNANCKNNATKGIKCETICTEGGYIYCEQCDRVGG